MDNQHKHIKGYRDLTEEEIVLINECKELEAKCVELSSRIGRITQEASALRYLSLAKTNIEQGFMWLVKSIAKPNTDWNQ